MEQKFRDLWSRLNVVEDPKMVFGELHRLYTQKDRYYHTLTHIDACLNELESVRSLVEDFDSLEFAFWYHDVVYDTKRGDNEEASANLALRTCRAYDLDFGSRVHSLILKTAGHDSTQDIDEQFMIDIDLAILGQNRDSFEVYETQIRQEYAWVPENIYNQKRGEILQGFLKRGLIYQTETFQERYQEQAIKNLEWSISNLLGN